jgi:hypothetical protein
VIGLDTKLRAGDNTHWKLKDGEGVVVDFTTGNYFVLDDVCSFFWKRMMDKPHTMQELVEAALEEYEAERDEVAANVKNFCEYVLSEKLAERAP